MWLLSDDSNWMPEDLRETLKRGFREQVSWWLTQQVNDSSYAVLTFLHERPRSRFRYTQALRAELVGWCDQALKRLEVAEDPGKVVSRFIEGGFLEGYYEEEQRMREARKTRRNG